MLGSQGAIFIAEGMPVSIKTNFSLVDGLVQNCRGTYLSFSIKIFYQSKSAILNS